MRRVGLALILMGTVGLLEAPAHAGHEALSALLPGSPLEGSRLFTGKGCLGCHAVQGVGGTAGPDLGRGTLNRPLLEIAGVMWNHSPGMERVFQERHLARPRLEPGEMASLLAFLYYLGSLDPPGDAEVGARLFRQKGCQTCHAVGGQGGRVGPALDRYSRYASPLHLTAGLWRHGPAMAAKMAERRVPRPSFAGNDIPDLLAHIRIAGGGSERVYARPGNPRRGEELFSEKRCVECHSVRGHGGKVGPDLGLTVRGSLMQIAGRMWNHGPKMWASMAERGIEVPSLDTEEMADLIGYLYFFQFVDPAGDFRRGSVAYKEKRCGTCHAATGAGKPVAPPLVDLLEKLGTPTEVVTAMWNHAGQMEAKMSEENVPWPVFKGGEMADLIDYLLSSRGASMPPASRAPPSEPTKKPR
jgi:mono/diheme cytochrome c family protein